MGAVTIVFILFSVAVQLAYSFKHSAEEIGRLKFELRELEKDNSALRQEREIHRACQAVAIEALARSRRPVSLSSHQPHGYFWPNSATTSTNVPHFFMVSRVSGTP